MESKSIMRVLEVRVKGLQASVTHLEKRIKENERKGFNVELLKRGKREQQAIINELQSIINRINLG